MKAIGLFINAEKLREEPEMMALSRRVLAALEARRAPVVVNQESASLLDRTDLSCAEEEMPGRAELLVVLGGDGTILHAARLAAPEGRPLLGVNVGGFGFLAEASVDEVQEAVSRLLAGDYALDERMMLEAAVERRGEVLARFLALNDMVITKRGFARLLRLRTLINDEHMATYPADGLIVSSPTGSTAYSLSAGGPIVHPAVDVITVTPICPHTLNARTVVVAGDAAVTVEVQGGGLEAMLTVDGQVGYPLQAEDRMTVRRSAHRTHLVRIRPFRFYTLLRQKLSWVER
ncbi:MAG: NAD(+)/NADH kinase [Armatimonadetes bacterium]|nr:NAD(+)/NADH kinase [Armatimonadota bacterium]